jgi:hypothetical protein
MNEHDELARRATSTPTPRDNDEIPSRSIQPLGITKQIDQVLNDMKHLLINGRDVLNKQEDNMIPERDIRRHHRTQTKKERAVLVRLE